MKCPTTPHAATEQRHASPWPLVTLAVLLALTGPPSALAQSLALRGGTFLGGDQDDMGWALCPASSGDLILVGETYSDNFPVTAGAFDTTYADSSEGQFVRISQDASSVTLASYLGSDLREACRAVALDAAGNIYVVGTTCSPDFPVTPNAAFPALASVWSDAFLIVLDPTGSELLYGTFLGGHRVEKGRGVALLGPDLVGVIGYTDSDDFPTSPFGFDRDYNGDMDLFFSVFNLYSGDMIYSTYIGGSADEEIWDIAVRPDGSSLLCGWTISNDFPTTENAFDPVYNGSSDAYVACVTPTVDGLRWSTFLGGIERDAAWDLCPVDGGEVLVTGSSEGLGFPVTQGSFDTSANGGSDAFVLRLTADGSALVFSTYLGGEWDDRGAVIRQSPAGVIYCGGNTYSPHFPIAGDVPYPEYSGGGDVFVAALSGGGSRLLASSFLGGGGGDAVYGLEIPGEQLLSITGLTSSADFPVTAGAFDSTLGGDRDAYFATFSFTGDQDVGGPSVVLTGETRLYCFPSPARSLTDLHFALEQPDRVRLDLLDPQGRLIETLLQGCLTSGEYAVPWPARGGRGRRTPLSPGVYWVRLEMGGGCVRVKRVLLAQ